MKKFLSIILALALLVSLVPAVFAAGETAARTHEFVIGLSSFNTADLKTGTAANSNAPELQNGTALWHQASMAWDAVIDGANTESGNAIDPFMNFSATDKWAFAGTNMTRLGNGGAKLEENYLQTQVGNGTFSGSYVYTAFKIYVEAPGTYTLQASSMEISGDSGKMQPKVYFFKDGEATVSTPNKYPSSALVDYFYTGDDGEYDTIGDITVNEAGTYIVSFVGTPGDTTTYPVSGNGKYYNLAISGIKLLADEVASISLSANSTEIAEGKTTALSVSATYTLSGATTVENTDVSFSVAPAGIVEVSAAGVVSAIAAGKATVTATYGGKSSSVEITVKSSAVARTHEYVIGLSSFNTADLKTVSGFYDGKLYNQASMAWDAVVDGANTTSGNAIDPFMNLSATDKWAFAGTNFSRATPYLSTDYLVTNVGNGTFSGSYIYTAFEVYVDAPGTYMLQARNTDLGGSGKMQPKVYFFKDGDATVSTPNKYPAASEVAYFDDWTSGEYTDIGEVTVDAAGTYVVSFAGIPGDATTYPVSGSGKHYYLAIGGIKLAYKEEPNEEITGNSVTIGLTAIANGVVSPEAKALLSESTVEAGNINSVTVGTSVTLKAADSADLKFLYWYNGNSGRMISDAATYTFTAGTNTPIFAKYADVNKELTEYFSTAGQLMEKDKGTFDAEPDRTLGDYYKLFKDTTAGVASTLINKISEAANFVCWKKNNEIVSYNKNYSFWTWADVTGAVEVTEGETSDVPAVVLFSNDKSHMLELVNFEGIEIIEKGILFGGELTVSSCAEKAISVENKNQFTASSDEETARAYVIYRDGATIRVAYSD